MENISLSNAFLQTRLREPSFDGKNNAAAIGSGMRKEQYYKVMADLEISIDQNTKGKA